MTTNARLLSGSIMSVYSGTVAAAVPVITPATGVIVVDMTAYALVGRGKYDDGVTIENMDERTQLRFQGSKGRISEERRTETGLMITVPVFDATPDLATLPWGNPTTVTAAGTAQVGHVRQDFDLPLVVPEQAIVCVIDSPYDEAGDEGWGAYVYIPKGTFRIGALNLAIDPEATSLEIRQLDHTTKAHWDAVNANAT